MNVKRILITGKDSYIGTAFEKWMNRPEFEGMYKVDTLDMREKEWENKDFSIYETILHLAGIVHQKETSKNIHLYYEVNRDLAIKTARKAKQEGVRQFIFLSTMGIYGKMEGTITEETPADPKTHYGKSKWQAEIAIQRLETPDFKIAVLRPPMVYGKGCKGNYLKLSQFARYSPIFPYTTNKRSMLYIDNLCDFIQKVIDEERRGVFFPQNAEYVNVSDMVEKIANVSGHRIFIIKGIERPIRVLGGKRAKKVLGTCIYNINRDRCSAVSYEESILRTEL